jgi:DNA repair and recombination protein RAD52
MIDWNKASAELNKKLDPSAIKPAPKGKFGDYVDGYHVISEANRIFGNGGWSYEITRLQQTHAATVTLNGQNGPYEQFRCSYLCTVKVTVGDTFKEGSAVGMGNGKPENMGDVIESAVKEAETDALKRALRTYGNTFGLALYDKSRENVGVEATTAEIEAAKAACAACDDLNALAAWWTALYKNARHVAENPAVYEAKEARKQAVTMRGAA